MRIYNGTNSQLDLPLSGIQRITIPEHSVSGDVLPSTEFLSLLVTSFTYDEIAIIVSGPFEINMCAGVTGCVGFVVQSLEEAIEKFTPKVQEEVVSCSHCHNNPCSCDKESGEVSDECKATCECKGKYEEDNSEKDILCTENELCFKPVGEETESIERKRKSKKKED